MSAHLQRIERFFGEPLFERGLSGVRPTRYGLEVLAQAREVPARAEAIGRRPSGSAAGRRRILRVASTNSPVLSGMMVRVRSGLPDVSLMVSTVYASSQIVELLEKGEVDAAIAADYPGMEFRHSAAGSSPNRRSSLCRPATGSDTAPGSKQTAVPDVWWIEGVAEYSSYGYRGITDDQAVAEAGKHTYTLSTLCENRCVRRGSLRRAGRGRPSARARSSSVLTPHRSAGRLRPWAGGESNRRSTADAVRAVLLRTSGVSPDAVVTS